MALCIAFLRNVFSCPVPFGAVLELNIHTHLAPLSLLFVDASTHSLSWFTVVNDVSGCNIIMMQLTIASPKLKITSFLW